MIINSSRLVAPCKGCTSRYVGCHSECDKYIEFRKALDEENAERYHAKQLYMDANQIQASRIEAVTSGKMYRRRRRKKT